jgi:hypothetical protein
MNKKITRLSLAKAKKFQNKSKCPCLETFSIIIFCLELDVLSFYLLSFENNLTYLAGVVNYNRKNCLKHFTLNKYNKKFSVY